VPFQEAGLLGMVTGFCYSWADIDSADIDIDEATVFAATIAHHLTVVPGGLVTVLPRPYNTVGRITPSALKKKKHGTVFA
jgi:hypothetical protein